MQNKVTFEYAVIRLVPKVEREEFLNVGVIIFSKRKNYLAIKYNLDEKKIRLFSDEIDIDMISSYLKAWELICEGKPHGGKIGEFETSFRFRWLVAARSTIIQSSQTHPGMCKDPEKVLNDLFVRYVL